MLVSGLLTSSIETDGISKLMSSSRLLTFSIDLWLDKITTDLPLIANSASSRFRQFSSGLLVSQYANWTTNYSNSSVSLFPSKLTGWSKHRICAAYFESFALVSWNTGSKNLASLNEDFSRPNSASVHIWESRSLIVKFSYASFLRDMALKAPTVGSISVISLVLRSTTPQAKLFASLWSCNDLSRSFTGSKRASWPTSEGNTNSAEVENRSWTCPNPLTG